MSGFCPVNLAFTRSKSCAALAGDAALVSMCWEKKYKPTPAMATMPSMPVTTIARTTQTHVLILPAIGVPQQRTRVLDARGIVASLAQARGLARFAGRGSSIAALQGKPP